MAIDLVCPRCGADGFSATIMENGDIDLTCYLCAQNGAVEEPSIHQRPEKVQEFVDEVAKIRDLFEGIMERGGYYR